MPGSVLEDWWLVRDGQGHAGWLLAGRLDVDVPDEIAAYGEGQRYVGAYVLNKVHDPEAATPDHEVPQYVTVLSPPRPGCPSTSTRCASLPGAAASSLRDGLPAASHPGLLAGAGDACRDGSAPTFSFQIANGPNLTTDPDTGITRPASPRTITYSMDDTRAGAPEPTGPDSL